MRLAQTNQCGEVREVTCATFKIGHETRVSRIEAYPSAMDKKEENVEQICGRFWDRFFLKCN